jgi:alkylhydroperoxidase family enzyme
MQRGVCGIAVRMRGSEPVHGSAPEARATLTRLLGVTGFVLLAAALQAPSLVSPLVSTAEQALLAYADVLTLTPAGPTRPRIDALPAAGHTDRPIHDACAIIGYFAFVNRTADGPGVQLERTTS